MPLSRMPRRSQAVRVLGYDVFISFALGAPPRGTRAYASDLARKLRERDFTVFFSEDEAPAGSELDFSLKRALRRSKILVVIANREALREPRWIRAEVEEFRRCHPQRAIVPISIDGALLDPGLSAAAEAWLPFRSKIWVDETGEACAAGMVSDAVIDRLSTAPTSVRAAVVWRRLVAGVIVFFASLAGFSTWMGIRADRAATEAERQRVIAVEQGQRALAGKLAAESRQRENRKPDLALLLAAQAEITARSAEVDDTLLSLLASKRRLVAYLRSDVGTPRQIDFSADGRRLAVLGRGKLQVWDTERRVALGSPMLVDAFDVAYARSPTHLYALSYNFGHALTALDSTSGRVIAQTALRDLGVSKEPQRVVGIRDAEIDQVAVSRSDGSFEVWALTDGQLRHLQPPELTDQDQERAKAALGARKEQRTLDNTWQVDANANSGDAYLTSPGTGSEREALIGHERGVLAVALDPTHRFVATAGAEGQVMLWRLSGSVLARWSADLPFGLSRVAYTRDRHLFVSGSPKAWAMFDTEGRPVHTQPPVAGDLQSGLPGVSSQGDVAAERVSPSGIQLRSTVDGTLIGEPLAGKEGWRPALIAFSPNDRLIAAGGQDNDVMLWDRQSGALIASAIKGHSGGYLHGLHTFAFSPDGRLLATGGRDKKIFFWDTATGKQVGEPMVGHGGAVEALAFSPDGRLLAVGGEVDRVTLYDLRTRKPLERRLSSTNIGVVKSLDFSPRGDLLVGAGRQLILWRLANGEPIFELDEADRSVAFNHDGTQLAMVRDKSVVVYDLEPAHWIDTVCGVVQRNLTCDEWTRHVGEQPYRTLCSTFAAPQTCSDSGTLPRKPIRTSTQ